MMLVSSYCFLRISSEHAFLPDKCVWIHEPNSFSTLIKIRTESSENFRDIGRNSNRFSNIKNNSGTTPNKSGMLLNVILVRLIDVICNFFSIDWAFFLGKKRILG